MPRSRTRHKHHAHPHTAGSGRKKSAAFGMALFIGFIGLAVAAVAGAKGWWLLAGAAIGIAAGYGIGHSMDRVSQKK